MNSTVLTRADYIGFAEIKRARERNVSAMFRGTQLKLGAKPLSKVLKSVDAKVKDAKRLAAGAKGTRAASGVSGVATSAMAEQVRDFIKACADVADIGAIAEAIGAEALADMVAELVPLVGIFKSGKDMVAAGAKVAVEAHNLYRFGSYKSGFLSGDPAAAADAVKVIIERDLAKHSINLARHSAATGLKIAGAFVDFGTATTVAVGVANSVAALALELAVLGMEIKELRAGNAVLKGDQAITVAVFTECPILGCYLLTCSDTSTVANMFVADIGLPGWMDKVELLKKKKMDPLLKIATAAINASRLQLENLSQDKGTHQAPGFFASKKKSAMKFLGLD